MGVSLDLTPGTESDVILSDTSLERTYHAYVRFPDQYMALAQFELLPNYRFHRSVTGDAVVQAVRTLGNAERQERRRQRHAHHVAEVRAGGDRELYSSVLAKVCRPSSTPERSTSRSRRRRMMSALSRATSTASATEIPTSAA